MILSIQKISVSNFKGIKSLELEFNGKSASITGRNGCGKSSIVDAFCWTLFGVNANGDSPGSDAFREKPLDDKGQIIHNLTTSVQIDFLLDEKPFNVRRELSESWVKRRGSVEPAFQGNVSKFFINDVELKKSEFEERIASIISIDTFKQIGILGYFNGMDWKKRRQYLLNIAGNDVDKQLLQKAEYKPIADEIDKRNIGVDDLKKVMSDQKKKLTTELKTLPVRIDEARKSMPTLKEHEASDAEYMLNDTKLSIEKIDRLIIDAKAQGSGGNSSRFAAIKSELESVKRRMTDEHEAERKKLEFEREQATSEVKSIENKIDDLKVEVNRLKESLSTTEKERDELRKEFITVRAQKAEISDTCPICGQTLPSDKVDEAHKEWEKNRKKRLLDIQTKGKSSADKVADLTARIKQQSAELERLEIDLSESRSKEKTASESLNSFPVEPDFDSNPRIHELEQRIEELKSTQQSTVDTDTRVEQLTARKNEMMGIIDRANQILLKRDMIAENEARIAGYESDMKDKGAELSEVELMLEQLDNFTQARCSALEDSLNSRFKSIRWKLFDTLINGSINDCCAAMIECDGAYVPYLSANTASQINSDIQIVEVLSDHYNVKIPLFVDNRERVVNLAPIDTQVITLAVTTDNELKVELLD